MNLKLVLTVIICTVAMGVGLFQTYRFFHTADPLGGQITRPIHCRCTACGAEFDMPLKAYYDADYAEAVAKAEGRVGRPNDAPGALPCPKCGKEYVAVPMAVTQP